MLVVIVFVGLAMIVLAANFRQIPHLLEPEVKKCMGYTIIEYDKAIDCYGDTVVIIRKNGFAEKALSYQK